MFRNFTIIWIILLFDFGSGLGNFWFLSDFHVDQNYSREGNPQNLCHDDKSNHSDNGLYGNFLCDTPLRLAHAAVRAMRVIEPHPDFIVYTGDDLPHTDPGWEVTYEGVNNITLLLMSTFPNTPIYPSIGNHDTSPPSILRPNDTSVYDGYLQKGGWNRLLSSTAIATFRKGGYYSEVIKPGLRLIGLNTILWYSSNNCTASEEDPAEQFSWLKEILNESLLWSEKVYIIGHVSPGFYSRTFPTQKADLTYHRQFLEKYLEILSQYSEIIVGQMYGHYHLDYFQLFRFNTGIYKNSAILASSVTPWHFKDKYNVSLPVNPSFKLVQYSDKDYSLLDFVEYYMDLYRVNSQKLSLEEPGLLFRPLYQFTAFYGVPDLSTDSLVKVYENLRNDDDLYQAFFLFLTAGKKSSSCSKDCKINQLCAMSGTSVEEYNQCQTTMTASTATKISFSLKDIILIAILSSLYKVLRPF